MTHESQRANPDPQVWISHECYLGSRWELKIRDTVDKFVQLTANRGILSAVTAGLLSGLMGAALHYYDEQSGSLFLTRNLPDEDVFSVFVAFASLVAAFRTGHALTRYADAAAYMHKLGACWFDTASTLTAFCRVSTASRPQIEAFQHVMVRLVSVLSALALDGLQISRKKIPSKTQMRHRFEVLGADDLDDYSQSTIMESDHKVECVFQMLQQLVMDAMQSGVLSVPAPILSRSIQEMGAGLVTYHEAKKLACVPIPVAYRFFTLVILVSEALFVPWMMAYYCQGSISSFLFTFMGVFLLWFISFVADSLDNPFVKGSHALEADEVQNELNGLLTQLLLQADSPTPGLLDLEETELCPGSNSPPPVFPAPARHSIRAWTVASAILIERARSRRLSHEADDLEVDQSMSGTMHSFVSGSDGHQRSYLLPTEKMRRIVSEGSSKFRSPSAASAASGAAGLNGHHPPERQRSPSAKTIVRRPSGTQSEMSRSRSERMNALTGLDSEGLKNGGRLMTSEPGEDVFSLADKSQSCCSQYTDTDRGTAPHTIKSVSLERPVLSPRTGGTQQSFPPGVAAALALGEMLPMGLEPMSEEGASGLIDDSDWGYGGIAPPLPLNEQKWQPSPAGTAAPSHSLSPQNRSSGSLTGSRIDQPFVDTGPSSTSIGTVHSSGTNMQRL